LVYSPVAVLSLLLTCTVISVDDGLLRTSTGCAGPLSSSTLYVDWLKLIVLAVRNNHAGKSESQSLNICLLIFYSWIVY